MIKAQNLSLSFGSKRILQSVDAEVHLGKIVALCGPNGAGKSTLLSAMAGDLSFSGGVIEYAQTPLSDMPPQQLARQRAVLEQSPSLTARFTVDELMRLSVPIEVSPSKTDQLVQSLLDQLGLLAFQHKMVETLSGGQRHRAHLARVLAQLRSNRDLFGPNCLFLDEPTASLDVLHQIEVMKIAKAEAKSGTGVLVVLHDLNLAAAFADTVILMQNGAVAKAGTVGEVFQARVLSEVYGTPIVVEKHGAGPLHIRPDLDAVA